MNLYQITYKVNTQLGADSPANRGYDYVYVHVVATNPSEAVAIHSFHEAWDGSVQIDLVQKDVEVEDAE